MKSFVKRGFALALVAVLVLSLTACGGFDAAAYVQGDLDLSFKGIVSDGYLKLVNASKEEAEAVYEQVVEAFADQEISSQDLSRSEITDECYENIIAFYKEYLGKAKYTVGEASRTSNGFEVEVSCEALLFLDQLNPDDFTTAGNEIAAPYLNKTSMSDQDYIELYSAIMNRYVELYHEALSKAEYGPAESLTLKLEMDSNNIVSISESSYTALQDALFQ